MKQTDRINQVTPVSKILAAVIIVTLPFLGFWVGFNYQSHLSSMYEACMNVVNTPTQVLNDSK